ncbi:odorant receptor 24a [Ooceraea biroi]|nr:odorant receptor 24a [Ooceraea biroi]XP_019887454.1 odorant receptor 24a [Ooceraea biroi]XP_019887455.1 odorant receptor 24a [Ooceraea biroi]
MGIVHHMSYWINTYTVKYFVERLQHICNELRDENEIAIIKKYANSAEYIAIFITLYTACCGFIITFTQIFPRILSTFLLVNISRPLYNVQFVTEYFIDKEKNFYLIFIHICASLYIGTVAFAGTSLISFTYFKHICGLFCIASYHMEQSMMLNIHKKTNLWNNMEIDKKIIHAVDIHRTAIELSEFFISNFNGTYFCVMLISVLCLSLNLYKLFLTVLFQDEIEEFLLHFIFATAILIHLFLANSCGEEITENYNNIFSAAYSVHWYAAPIRIQKLILFLLQRSCKTHGIKLGGIFIASLEGFAALSATSLSYFTVLYSLQK